VASETEAEITKILALLEDSTAGAVFVHCNRGSDRTGAVIAAYRIDHDHWNNLRALKEAMSFGMSPYQSPRQNFIRRFQPLTIKRIPKTSTASVTVASPHVFLVDSASRKITVWAERMSLKCC
jgi:protein tyrosine/serine phosphatase